MDTVDALHCAEDSMGALRAALVATEPHLDALPTEVADQIRTALIFTTGYCRCDLDENGICDDEFCGCPGEHDFAHA